MDSGLRPLELGIQTHNPCTSAESSTVGYDSRRTHGIFNAMYTTEMCAGSGSIVGHWLVSPHTDRHLVPGLSLEGGIFKEQPTTLV